MKQIQANRLVVLMNMMQSIPKRNFNIGHWGDNNIAHNKKDKVKAIDCGTSACAVGWAAISLPVWRKHFKLQEDGNLIPLFKDKDDYHYNDEFDAIADFLGIHHDEAFFMFNPLAYDVPTKEVTKQMVIVNCREILKEHGYVWA